MAQFVAAFSNPATIDATSIRIDHSFNDKFTMFGRYSDSPSKTVARVGGIGSLANPFTTSTSVRSLTIGVTNLLNARLTNNLLFNSTSNKGRQIRVLDNFGGAVPFGVNDITTDFNGQATSAVDAFSFQLLFGGFDVYALSDLRDSQHQINIIDTLSYSLAAHSLKFGVDYRRLTSPLALFKLQAIGSFSTQTQVKENLVSSGSAQSSASIPIGPVYENLSLFAQDDWRVTRRLNLSLGLRWELNPAPTDAFGNPPYTLDQITNLATSMVAPKGTPLWQTTHGNFAPRLGAAYQLRQKPGRETVIRGGFA